MNKCCYLLIGILVVLGIGAFAATAYLTHNFEDLFEAKETYPYGIIGFDLSSGEAIQTGNFPAIGFGLTREDSTINLRLDEISYHYPDGVYADSMFDLPEDVIGSVYNDGELVCLFDTSSKECTFQYDSGYISYGMDFGPSYFEEFGTAHMKIKMHVIKN